MARDLSRIQAVIILLGGTAETKQTASALAEAGYAVLVCTATDVPIDIGEHPAIARRCGRLDEAEMAALATALSARAIVDIGHPYALRLHANARAAAAKVRLPYFRLKRDPTEIDPTAMVVKSHEEAAALACSTSGPVLLTIGTQNLKPYLREATRNGVRIIARILDQPASLVRAGILGLENDAIVAGRGPFSVRDNLALLRRFAVQTLVTKDGGAPSGINAKLQAAAAHGCRTIIVRRPKDEIPGSSSVADLIASILSEL